MRRDWSWLCRKHDIVFVGPGRFGAYAPARYRDAVTKGEFLALKILLTQGGRFYLYRQNKAGTWEDEPSGYINVEKIRTNHIAPVKADAVETLRVLTQPGVHRP